MRIYIDLMETEPLGKKGYPVKIIVTHKQKFKRKTIGHSFPEHWDYQKKLPNRKHPNVNDFAPDILKVRARIYDAEKLSNLDEALQYLLKNDEKEYNSMGFVQFSEKLIDELKKMKREGNARVYDGVKNQIILFCGDVLFSDIDYNFIQQYRNFKIAEGLKKNSVSHYLRAMRAIYNEAVRRGFVEDGKPFKGVFKGIIIKSNRTKKKHLDLETLRKLEKHNLNGEPGRSVDLWLLMFYLGGQNLKDVYFLKSEKVKDDRAYFQRGKLGENGYQFDVKIFDKALKILNRYGSFTNEYVFPYNKSYTRYQTFRRNTSRGLRIAQEKLSIEVMPIGGVLGINVARHTFSTIGVKKGVNRQIKGLLMGHDIGDVQSIYEDYPVEMRDAAHWDIISL